MGAAFLGLTVGLQTELLLLQQFANHRAADPVPQYLQFRRQMPQALACPAQRRHRIATLVGSTSAFRSSAICYPSPPTISALLPDGERAPAAAHQRPTSFSPRPIVLAAMRVTRATAAIPPWPAAFASAAANRRRRRSSRCGNIAALRSRSESSSIIPNATTPRARRESHICSREKPIQLFPDGP